MVISGAYLGDMLDAAPLPPGDETDLGVDLDPLKAVLHRAAGVLQPLGPRNIVLLVEAGPQLHEDGDVLAVLRRRGQVLNELGLGGQAVDGDLDGEHIGVVGRLADELEKGVHGVEGIEEERVVPQDLREDPLTPAEAHWKLRGKGLIAQRGSALPGELALQGVDIVHRKGGFAVEGLLTAQMQALQQVGHQGVAGVPLDFQADGGQPGALFEDLAHVLAVIVVDVVILILRGDVRVPGDGDDRLALHGVLVKDISHVFQHKLLDEHIAQAAFIEPEVGGDALGNGHDAETALAVPLQGHGDVQGLAGQVGEGVVGVHHLWGEDGQHIVPEVPLALLALLYVQLLDGEIADVAGPQPGLQLCHELVPLLVEGPHGLKDGGELLGGGKAALGVHMGLLDEGQVVNGAHPDHKELVQVAGEDGREFEPLKEGDALVAGLLHHALVEPEPGELPVLCIAEIQGLYRHVSHTHSFMTLSIR